jgi:cysteine-rich repeat protein
LVLPPIDSRSSINQHEIKHIVDTVALFLNLISITHQTIHFQYSKNFHVLQQLFASELVLQITWMLNDVDWFTSASCKKENGYNCDANVPTVCVPICGDGLKVSREQCDDGNLNIGDGCSGILHQHVAMATNTIQTLAP